MHHQNMPCTRKYSHFWSIIMSGI